MVLSLFGCMEKEQAKLADTGASSTTEETNKALIKAKTDAEIRAAYTDFLKNASMDNNARLKALSRLAELEFRHNNKLHQQQEELSPEEKLHIDDSLYYARLDKVIDLLNTSLADYPDSRNNDTILYRLAKAYDQRGNYQASIDALIRLVEKHPKSSFYVEAQFRIGESAFSFQNYSTAEHAYTEVITAKNNHIFYEKALFKRGWSRFKQQYYIESVDDFLAAVVEHDFAEFEKLTLTERELFDEYFRAIGLAFSYLGGSESLHDYFKNQPDFIYTYHIYSVVADKYLKQERFSDAVATHQQFIKHNPNSDNIPYSHLKIIEIWKNSGFTQKVYPAIEDFYVRYNPSSTYWKDQNENSRVNRAIRRALREYVVLMTAHYHSKYQRTKKNKNYQAAERWYKRYLQHYSAYAQNDNIYFLYGELLAQRNRYQEALKYYEFAAFDHALIIHKKAAYATVYVSSRLLAKNINVEDNLKKHITYALRYVQKYPEGPKAQQIITHAASLSFKSGDYKSTIELVDSLISSKQNANNTYLANLKAASYFKLHEYAEAESLYSKLLQTNVLSRQQRREYTDKLALSIYQQGEQAQKNNDIPTAIKHFSRIASVAMQSTIAATGLYDAIALNMQHKQWGSAISKIKQFQRLFPGNKLQADVTLKLSVAYLNSNQRIKAASAFEKMSTMGSDVAIKSAALWQAALLYEEKDKIDDAIRSYEEYVRRFTKPYSQYIESMQKLTELYTKKGSPWKTSHWRKRIIAANNKALNNVKTDRTRYITSNAYLGLARSEKSRFNQLSLTLPLDKSLKKKKATMQNSVRYFGNASKYKRYEATTEATYSIALIYKHFSSALLESDRPEHLNTEELDQYEILLEDMAFPFEDKAIEFFEINMSRIQDGKFNEWIKKSRQELITLFPARYGRQAKVDTHINALH